MALFLPLLVAAGIYNGLVTTIGSVTMATCRAVKRVYTHKNPDVTKLLKQLDLERRLTLVQSILNVTGGYNLEMTDINEEKGANQNPIELCLISLQQSIQDIHDDLIKIEVKVESHKRKWFNSWRTLNIKEMLENLDIHSQQLDRRFEDLNKVTTFLVNRKISTLAST